MKIYFDFQNQNTTTHLLMFNFDYHNRVESYLWRKKYLVFNTFDDIFDIMTSGSLLHPKLCQIKDIAHAIVLFPDGKIFNCNPRDYPLPIILPLRSMVCGLQNKQVEPSSAEYEKYWNEHEMDPDKDTVMIGSERNCGSWSAYYLWWHENGDNPLAKFPQSLFDLEKWTILMCEEYLDKSKDFLRDEWLDN